MSRGIQDMGKDITKVEFTFSDGSVQWVENTVAQEWFKAINEALVVNSMHGHQFDFDHSKWKWKPLLYIYNGTRSY